MVEETCQVEGAWVEPLCGDKPDKEVLTRGLRGHSLMSKLKLAQEGVQILSSYGF